MSPQMAALSGTDDVLPGIVVARVGESGAFNWRASREARQGLPVREASARAQALLRAQKKMAKATRMAAAMPPAMLKSEAREAAAVVLTGSEGGAVGDCGGVDGGWEGVGGVG